MSDKRKLTPAERLFLDRRDAWLERMMRDPGMTGTACRVLHFLAKHLDWKTGEASPPVATLAGYFDADDRTVTDVLRLAVAMGWLTQTAEGRGRHRPNTYRGELAFHAPPREKKPRKGAGFSGEKTPQGTGVFERDNPPKVEGFSGPEKPPKVCKKNPRSLGDEDSKGNSENPASTFSTSESGSGSPSPSLPQKRPLPGPSSSTLTRESGQPEGRGGRRQEGLKGKGRKALPPIDDEWDWLRVPALAAPYLGQVERRLDEGKPLDADDPETLARIRDAHPASSPLHGRAVCALALIAEAAK